MGVENFSPPELVLLNDSRVRSIKSRSIEVATYDEGDYTHEAILDLVSGINPHIRNVSFLAERNQHSASNFFLDEAMNNRSQLAPWSGLSRGDTLQAPCARLQSLEIGPLSIGLCQKIFMKCDLEDLQVLKLPVNYKYKGLDYIASSVQFPSLRSLVLGAQDWTEYQEIEHGKRDLAVPLLSSLPQLKAIRFNAYVHRDLLECTLRRHGSTLRRLWFAPSHENKELSFDAQQVARLREGLPLLEDLAISTQRSLGSTSEVAIYKQLGLFPRLSTLSLYLDCHDPTLTVYVPDDVDEDDYDPEPVYYPDFDDFDRECVDIQGPCNVLDPRIVLNGHVRNALVNAALDKHLSRAIFEAVASSKPGLASDVPLQRLEIRPRRGDYYTMMQETLAYLSQWWAVEAFAGEPIVTPIWCHGDLYLSFGFPALPKLEADVETIFRKIWSRRRSGDSWYYDWCIVPLKTQ